MNPVSICVANDAVGNQDGVIRLCGRPETSPASAADWIAEIKRIWAHGPASTLELARAVAAAKKTARHGQWQEVWKALPFSRRKADMLAVIGSRLDWVNWQTFADLPVGWSILYELSKLKRAAFEALVGQGMIHPGLKLCAARRLVAQCQGNASEVNSRQARVQNRLRRFEEFVCDTLHGWTPAERELAQATLTQLTKRIGQPSSLVFDSDSYLKNKEAQFRRTCAFRSGFST